MTNLDLARRLKWLMYNPLASPNMVPTTPAEKVTFTQALIVAACVRGGKEPVASANEQYWLLVGKTIKVADSLEKAANQRHLTTRRVGNTVMIERY